MGHLFVIDFSKENEKFLIMILIASRHTLNSLVTDEIGPRQMLHTRKRKESIFLFKKPNNKKTKLLFDWLWLPVISSLAQHNLTGGRSRVSSTKNEKSLNWLCFSLPFLFTKYKKLERISSGQNISSTRDTIDGHRDKSPTEKGQVPSKAFIRQIPYRLPQLYRERLTIALKPFSFLYLFLSFFSSSFNGSQTFSIFIRCHLSVSFRFSWVALSLFFSLWKEGREI